MNLGTRVVRRFRAVVDYVRVEAASGAVLMIATVLALIAANSGLSKFYYDLTHFKLGPLDLHVVVNDYLMAVFFLVVGLEIKREVFEGELSSFKRAILPGVAAVGGIIVPAAIYLALNAGDPALSRGWAIPTATDIAFSLGILSLFGRSVPMSLKIFLTALAIIDDLMAVLAIAIFYTSEVSLVHLGWSAGLLVVLALMSWRGVRSLAAYLIPGVVLVWLVYQSGVHATIAGVLLAMVIPIRSTVEGEESPLVKLEHSLHGPVAFVILPIFAFFNAGVVFGDVRPESWSHSVTLGVMLGLLVGKQIGVFGLSWLLIKLKVTELPPNVSWGQFWGLSVLTGIGFTMSLFIGGLAFESAELKELAKLGVMVGSLLSAVLASILLFGFRNSEPD
jgi:NhaA family Na+:H+ antiporter